MNKTGEQNRQIKQSNGAEIVQDLVSVLQKFSNKEVDEMLDNTENTEVQGKVDKKVSAKTTESRDKIPDYAITAYTSEEQCTLVNLKPCNSQFTGEIKLDPKNIVIGRLNQEFGLRVVIDTGSSKSLLCEDIVKENSLLSKLEKIPIKETEMFVGNGQKMKANYMIHVNLEIQGYEFKIPFLVTSPMTRNISIIGNDVLNEIEATIEVARHNMKFQFRPIEFKAEHDCIIRPRSQKKIKISPKDPKNYISGSIPIERQGHKLRTEFHDGQGEMQICNNSEIDLHIRKHETVGKSPDNVVLITSVAAHEKHHHQTDYTVIDIGNTEESKKTASMENIQASAYEEQNEILHNAVPVENESFPNDLNSAQASRYSERIKEYPWLDRTDERLYLTVDEIVDQKIQFTNTTLSEKEQDQLRALIKENTGCFSLFDEIGMVKGERVDIPFEKYEAFALRPYPVPPKHREEVNKEIIK